MSAAETHGTEPSSTTPPEAVATLRRLKEAELLAQKRLEEARQRGEGRVKEVVAAREKALSSVRQEADVLRARRLQEARNLPDGQKVIATAQAEAARLGSLSAQDIDQRTEEILSVVLGDLRTPGAKVPAPAR